LHNEEYTGKAISNKYVVDSYNAKKSIARPKSEWIIIPNAHEAIITEEEFKNAHDIISGIQHGMPSDHIFFQKVYCAACKHVMKRSKDKYNPVFKCHTTRFTNHYPCPNGSIPQSIIEQVVHEAFVIHVDLLIEQDKLKLDLLRHADISKEEIKTNIKMETLAIKPLEDSIVKIFASFASGEMTQEAFVSKKELIYAAIAKKKDRITALEAQLTALMSGREALEASLAELLAYKDTIQLSRELVNALINKVVVRSSNDIEVVWNDRP
jgi:hypothetical protein